jgi:hypothetical protein
MSFEVEYRSAIIPHSPQKPHFGSPRGVQISQSIGFLILPTFFGAFVKGCSFPFTRGKKYVQNPTIWIQMTTTAIKRVITKKCSCMSCSDKID